MHATVTTFLQGFCPTCGGRVDATLEGVTGDATPPCRTRFACGRCGDELVSSPVLPALHHPTTVAFFERLGVDVLHDPSWRYYADTDEVSIKLLDDDPPRARVTFVVDGVGLRARIGSDGTVQDVTVTD